MSTTTTSPSPQRAPHRTLTPSRNLWLWFGFAAASVFLIAFLVNVVVTAIAVAVNFDGYAANGALQIYNPLRRIAQGELPGRDFPFFHGVGVPMIHYPLFELFGGNIFASEMSRYLISPLLFLLTSAVFFFAYFKDARRVVIATGLYTAFSLAFNDIVTPGNSIVGVRSALPIVVAALLLWKPRHSWTLGPLRFDLRLSFAMLGLGLAVSFGTEQAIAAILAYFVVRALVLWRHATWLQRIGQLAVEALIVTGWALLALTLFTGGHAFSALKYALFEIPQDQGWYFGVPPNQFLTLANIVALAGATPVPFIVITCVATVGTLLVARRLGLVNAHQARTFLYLAVYGVLACVSFLGYFWPPTQMAPLGRAAGIILIALLLDLLSSDTVWAAARNRAHQLGGIVRDTLALTLVVLVAAFAMGTLGQVLGVRYQPVPALVAKAIQAPHEDDYFSSSASWRERLDTFGPLIPEGSTVWSTYTSLYESNRGILNPVADGEDYIIHALGAERREAYVAQFTRDRPEFVITMKPSYFIYEEWLWGGNTEFYKQLVGNYELAGENTAHYLWRLTVDEPQADEAWMTAPVTDNGFTLGRSDASETSLYEVRLTYDASANLPLVGNIPRYLVTGVGSGLVYPVSLPPGSRTYSFLVPMIEGQDQASLSAQAAGIIPTASVEITKAEYRALVVPSGNYGPFINNFCAYGSSDPSDVCGFTRPTTGPTQHTP